MISSDERYIMNTVVWNESVHEQLIIREIRGLCDEGEDTIMEFNHGVLFSDTYQKKLKSQFYYADKDPQYGARLF